MYIMTFNKSTRFLVHLPCYLAGRLRPVHRLGHPPGDRDVSSDSHIVAQAFLPVFPSLHRQKCLCYFSQTEMSYSEKTSAV